MAAQESHGSFPFGWSRLLFPQTGSVLTLPRMQAATDFAPLWLPDDETIAAHHVAVGPADRVEGWSWQTLALASILGSRSKTATRVGLLMAMFAALALAPTLARGNADDLIGLAMFQGLVLVALLISTRRVRSISVTTMVVFWLAGLFITPLGLVAFDRLLALVPVLEGEPQRWIRPLLALVAGLVPLLPALLLWPRRFRHPGVSDLVLLGAAVGAGFTMHEDAVLDATTRASLMTGNPLLWLALLGGVLGLLVLERRDEVTIIAAAGTTVLVVGDATILDLRGVTAGLLLVVLGWAVTADRRRLREVARRDHLFPDATGSKPDAMVDRYRRLRAGVHTTLARQGEHWPPVTGAPVAELARAGRAAGVEVGRETSRNGWDRDPEDRSGLAHRFYGPNGWTSFTVDRNGVGQAPTRTRPEAGVRDLTAGNRKPMSAPLIAAPPDHLGWVVGGGVAVLIGLLGWLTISTELLDAPSLLTDASGPPLIRTFLGAVGIAAAVIGRARPSLGEAWELGPPDHHEV